MRNQKLRIISVAFLMAIFAPALVVNAQDSRPVPAYGWYMNNCVKLGQPPGGFGSSFEKSVEEAYCQCKFEHLPKGSMTKDQLFTATLTCQNERGVDQVRFAEKYYPRINRGSQEAGTPSLMRTPDASKQGGVGQPAPAAISAEDTTSLAAQLIAQKEEYAVARAMLSNGGSVTLTPTLTGMMGTDNFGERPWCLVSMAGRGPEAAKGVAKWRLVYRREKAIGDDVIVTSKWDGGSAPPRVSFDDDTSYINAPGAAISLGNSDFAKRLAIAKTVTFKHTSNIVFAYDAHQLRLAQAIVRKACP